MQLNKQTYEEFFLMYIDGELNEAEKKQVQDFIQQYPELEQEFRTLQQSVFIPEEEIQFDNKELLYRKEDDRRIPVMWGKMAAAALVILSLSIAGWLFLRERPFSENPAVIATTTPSEVLPETTATKHPPAIHSPADENQPAITQERHIEEKPSESKPDIKPVSRQVGEKNILIEPVVQPATKPQKPAIQSFPDIEEPTEQLATNEPEPRAPLQQQKTSTPEYAALEPEITSTINNKTKIEINVDPKKLENEIYTTVINDKPEIYYANAADNDMIYFANTAIPKKNSLRGIFRTASRIIDKVTSSQ